MRVSQARLQRRISRTAKGSRARTGSRVQQGRHQPKPWTQSAAACLSKYCIVGSVVSTVLLPTSRMVFAPTVSSTGEGKYPVDAECPHRSRSHRGHAEPPVVVDVGCPENDTGELAHQVGLLVGERAAAEHPDRLGAVGASAGAAGCFATGTVSGSSSPQARSPSRATNTAPSMNVVIGRGIYTTPVNPNTCG